MLKKRVGFFRSRPWWPLIVCWILITSGCAVHSQDPAISDASDSSAALEDSSHFAASGSEDAGMDLPAGSIAALSPDSNGVSTAGSDKSVIRHELSEEEKLFPNEKDGENSQASATANETNDTVEHRSVSSENDVDDDMATLSVDLIVNDMHKRFQQLVSQLNQQEEVAEKRKDEIEKKLRNSIQRVEKIKSEKQQAKAFIERLDPALESMELEKKESDVIYWGHVSFKVNSAAIASESMGLIEKLAQFLIKNPDRKVSIEGYADNYGKKQYNMELSKRRAVAVLNALIMKGVDIERIKQVVGHGNRHHGDKKLSRTVELIVSK